MIRLTPPAHVIWSGTILAALLAAAVGRAGTGVPIAAPNPKIKPRHGIKLIVDPTWAEGRGYRPVRVTAQAVQAVNYDRTVTVQFLTDSSYWRQIGSDMSVSEEMILPANATSASLTIAVPQFTEWSRVGWNVFVDGEYASELSVAEQRLGGNWHMATPRVLYVDSSTAAMKPAAAPIPAPNRDRWQQPRTSVAAVTRNGPTAHSLAPADLPVRWIDYSSLDIVEVSIGDLHRVVEQFPEAWTAISRWVGSGGNLVVYGLNAEWTEAAFVEGALGLPTELGGSRSERGWRKDYEKPISSPEWDMRLGNFGVVEEPPVGFEDFETPGAEQAGEIFVITDGSGKVRLQRFSDPFLWRNFRLGTVTLVAAAKKLDFDSSVRWAIPVFERQLWTLRHGVSPENGSHQFLDFLIPDVGLPPVNAFRFLITVFVVAIGPINYFLLRHWKRLYLLLITVPVSAALVTVAIFGYALMADGLGTRVRIRSFTEIDQRTGEAVCWARRSYYAGLAPRNGLSLPRDVQVISIPAPYRSRYEVRSARAVDWDGQQRLVDGWLDSRTPTQYMTVRARQTDHRLNLTSANGRLLAENRLGTRIQYLVVTDKEGTMFWGEAIEAQSGPQQLAAIELEKARDTLERVFALQVPRHPNAVRRDDTLLIYSRQYRYGSSRGNFYNPNLSSSRLEWAMTQYGAGPKWTPPPSTFLAIVDRSPEIELGVESAQEQASFHVVLGRF